MNFRKRSLITLGWVSISPSCEPDGMTDLSQIHTHPTQSCFMSSVDLHTHSGFRSITESFAVIFVLHRRRRQSELTPLPKLSLL